ncbi:MAG: DUF6644 family protein [Candidatus Acidiferrales bacterium]
MHLRLLILHFCQWCNASPWGHGVRDSVWLFPFVEIFHLLALGVLGGTILIVNLRLLGFRFQGEPVSELAEDVQPWMLGSLAVMLVSGFFLFCTEAVKMYDSPAFHFKMIFLLLAIVFTFTIHRKLVTADDARFSRFWRAVAAVVCLILWACVGLGGRAIGYYGT